MTNKEVNDLSVSTQSWGETPGLSKQSADSYAEFCSLDFLQTAYGEVRKKFHNEGIRLEAEDAESVLDMLHQLQTDLQARTYRPATDAHLDLSTDLFEGANRSCIRDQVIEFALKLVLDRAFTQTIPCDREPEEAIKWLAGVIEKGLTRVYAVTLEGSLESVHKAKLLQQVTERIEDREIVGLLEKVFDRWLERRATASKVPAPAARIGEVSQASGSLAQRSSTPPVLASVVYAEIDDILQQVNKIGRRETFSLVRAARFGNEVIILSAPDANVDWVLPAVEVRLREAVQRFGFAINGAETRFADLARGEALRLLGFELHCTAGKGGSPSVRYHRVERAIRPIAKETQRTSPRKARQPHRVPGMLNLRSNRGRWVYGTLLIILVEIGLVAWVFWPSGDNDPLRYEQFVRPSGDRVSYAMYSPGAYRSAKSYPLIVFLHGAGVPDLHGKIEYFPGIHLAIRLAIQRGEPLEFVVLFPLGRQGTWAQGSDDSRLVTELVDEVCKNSNIDPNRIYLTGFAAGGTGVWNLAAEHPDRWAAIVPVSGSPGRDSAARVAHLPCWCFQGQYGGIEAARDMIKALEVAGGKPRFTEVRGRGHDIWNQAYLNKDLYGWLAEQRRGG
jgi:predicted esterase